MTFKKATLWLSLLSLLTAATLSIIKLHGVLDEKAAFDSLRWAGYSWTLGLVSIGTFFISLISPKE